MALLMVGASAMAIPIPSSNLQLWLAGDYGVETTGNVAAANNDPVIAWRDQSGNNNHAFVAAPVGSGNSPLLYQPAYKTATLNGKPTLLFELGPGNQEYARMRLNTPLLTGTTDFSIFAVVKFSTLSVGERIIGSNYGLGDFQGLELYGYNNSVQLFKNGYTTSSQNPHDGNYHLITATRSGNTMSVYIDNVLSGTTTYAVGSIPGGLNWTIGNAPDYAASALGNLAEEIVYDRALSAAERDQVAYYLADQYALSAIPEPASLTLAVAGVAMVFVRRRRPSKA